MSRSTNVLHNTSPISFDIGAYCATIRSGIPGTLGNSIAEAIQKSHDAAQIALGAVNVLSDFRSDQRGYLSIQQLSIREHISRFQYEDQPDIQAVAAATYRIPYLGSWMRLNNTSGGALTLTSLPTIAIPPPAIAAKGPLIELFNVSANNIIVQDDGTLAGSKLRLGANTRTLGTRDSICLRYSQDIGAWIERWFSNVL